MNPDPAGSSFYKILLDLRSGAVLLYSFFKGDDACDKILQNNKFSCYNY